MPGQGTGIFNVSAFTCLWLVLGLLIIKPGTALFIAVLIMIFGLAISLALGGHHGEFTSQTGICLEELPPLQEQRTPALSHRTERPLTVDRPWWVQQGEKLLHPGTSQGSVIRRTNVPSYRLNLDLVVAIIVEIAGLLALEKKPWRYIFPAFLAIMGIITLVLMLTNNAKMGENGAAATVFPLGYAATGILALCLAVDIVYVPVIEIHHRRRLRGDVLYRFCWTSGKALGYYLGARGPGDPGAL